MTKTFLSVLTLVASLAGAVPVAQAITLKLVPSASPILVGGNVSADLVVADLAGSTVGVFDINLDFDAAVLSLVNVTFGGKLGDVSLGEATSSFDDSITGTVNLFELSLLETSAFTCVTCVPPYLEDLQSASFVLATLSFSGNAAGISALTPVVHALGDGEGNDLQPGLTIQSGSVTVEKKPTTGVPEPGTLALFSLGLAGLWSATRKSQRA